MKGLSLWGFVITAGIILLTLYLTKQFAPATVKSAVGLS